MFQTVLTFDATAPRAVPAPAHQAASAATWGDGARLDRNDPGFDIGWCHAQWGMVPPAEHCLPGHPVRQGWDAARRLMRGAAQPAHAAVRTWLALRLAAWHQGLAFEEVQVTPHYLAQLAVAQCPITRLALKVERGGDQRAVVARVCEQAGVAAGNLAMVSALAQQAKAGLRWDEARSQAALAAGRADGVQAGLSAPQWQRLAALMSYVTPLPHEVAAALPLAVLPPNRLRLLNPIQGLQALMTLQFTQPGWSRRRALMAELLPAGPVRRDFHLVANSLLPAAWRSGRPEGVQQLKERLEDAWMQPEVLRRWQRFALQLSAEQSEAVSRQAAQQGLLANCQRLRLHTDEQAVEGWALERRGSVQAQAA